MKSIIAVLVLITAMAAQAGWNEKAEEALKKMLDGESGPTLAKAIVNKTHPTGTGARLESYKIRRVGDKLNVLLKTKWKGGISETEHGTVEEKS